MYSASDDNSEFKPFLVLQAMSSELLYLPYGSYLTINKWFVKVWKFQFEV